MKIRIIILCLFMLSAVATISYASRPEVIPLRQPLGELPMQFAGWEGRRLPDSSQKVLDILGVDDYINRSYHIENSPVVSLYIGYFQSQRAGKSIHSPLNCLPGSGWIPVRNERIFINVGKSAIQVNRITIQKGATNQVVLYWYQSQGRAIASEYMGKIYTVLGAMRTNRTDAALVRIISPISANGRQSNAEAEEASEKAAIEFIQALFPLLVDYLPE